MTDWIGKTLGRVRIERLLARGGMAEVYLGTHTTLQRKVAVKILRSFPTDELNIYQRFEREARVVAHLRHPNIVQVFDFDTVEDQPYLVMEYIPGPPLSKYLGALHEKGGRLGLPLINRLLTRVADALQYAHKRGVIHRDVKPGNILLDSRSIKIIPGETLPLDLEPVLTDFGLVRFLNSSRQTASGLVTGTPAYMSPEQAMGEATDGRTDIYSLGIVLYEMLSGKIPFDAESTLSILLKQINEAPAPIPGLSPVLQGVLDRALAKHPADRFQEPQDFAAAFHSALEGTSEASTLTTIPQVLGTARSNKWTPSKTRTPLRWLPAVVAGALILAVGASLLWNAKSATRTIDTPAVTVTSVSAIPVSETLMPQIPVTFLPSSNLQFQDGGAILSRVRLSAEAMPAPPANHQYKAWLINGQDRLFLGVLQIDANGKGELIFDDPQNRNLLAYYDGVEVTGEPIGSSDANAPGDVVYAYTLPQSGIGYLRGLMVSFSGTPEQAALIQGLSKDAKLLAEASKDMLTAYNAGNEAGTRQQAESIINLLVGNQGADYKDWNGDGQKTDPGDGYGFFLNGNNLGYVQAVYSYVDYAVNSPGASQNMINNGNAVKVCAENLARWAPELRNRVSSILNAATLSGMDSEIQRSAELADKILNGEDKNEDGEIEPISEECGALVAYDSTYHMADMPLLPVIINSLGTPVAITETFALSPSTTFSAPLFATSTKPPNQGGAPATVAPTNVPPTNVAPTSQPPPRPTSQPKPTQKPKPTDKPKPTNQPGPSNNPKPTKKNP